ncbi:hypothetical protein J8629_15410 [Serratia fonticola]|uniref:hypothetical protein n=1 Tax=Serratia fonticola TaxID=47917 RepID=UPI001AE2054D|nr:hypothetical protein [Serratia fonticola]MBP0998439.1 hypothetical protein [Serratia fonticola]
MSGFKGTPGPWFRKDVSICRQDKAGLQIGFLSTGCEKRRDEGLANAHLIVAAPELLESLQEVMAALTDLGFDGPAERKAQAAINKALGE